MQDLVGGEALVALAKVEKLVAGGAFHTGGEGGDALLDAVLRGGDQLGGGGRRGGAEVGDKIGDGEVGLVADGGDTGELGGGDGASEGFVVEAGEIFDGAAAAGEDDEIDFTRIGVEPADAGGDRAGAVCPLHGSGVDEEVEAGVTAADDGDDVADDGAGGRGDDADAARERRQGALAGGVEESLGGEALLELLEGELQGAAAARLHGLGDQLQLATALVDGDAAAHQHGEAVGGAEAEKLGLAAEEDRLAGSCASPSLRVK